MNILEIRNAGPGGVVFRGFRVSRFPALLREGVLKAGSAESPPASGRRRGSAGLPREVARIADEVASLADSSRRMMEKAARGLPLKLTRMVEEGGGWFSVARLARREGRRGYAFFDELTRKPLPQWFALGAVAPLFEGGSRDWRRLPLSLAPKNGEESISCVEAAVAANNADTVTVALASWPADQGKTVELTFPVPWTGKTVLREMVGIVPAEAEGAATLTASGWLSARHESPARSVVAEPGVSPGGSGSAAEGDGRRVSYGAVR
jgi:hypothetical protein